MENLSEVLKILEGALKSNGSMASNYAGLLADKLEQVGERRQATLIREMLARRPKALAFASDASEGISMGQLPLDSESRLQTVDVSTPELQETDLLLPTGIESRLKDFLNGVRHHDELVRADATLPSRLLVYGPPGTGKTQLARYIASSLKMPLLTTRCDTLVSSMLGQTSRNLRRVFDFAQQTPSVLFLDEFDSLAGARGNERDVGELQRVVIALLQNMDALPDNTILIAATNHEQLLDPAIWRRFAFRINMPLPDMVVRSVLWKSMLGDFAPKRVSISELAKRSEGASGAIIKQVCLDAKRDAVIRGQDKISEVELYRRLGLNLALSRGEALPHVDDEIRWLRSWAPRIFSLRNLAGLYGVTVRTVSGLLKEKNYNGSVKK